MGAEIAVSLEYILLQSASFYHLALPPPYWWVSIREYRLRGGDDRESGAARRRMTDTNLCTPKALADLGLDFNLHCKAFGNR